MTITQLMPWIGGPAKFEAGLSPLICPIDDTVASHMLESDGKVVNAAVEHAHAAFLKHQDATTVHASNGCWPQQTPSTGSKPSWCAR
jgi:hypothetical protein